MRVGVWLYGLATVVTGILNIVWGQFEKSHQPIQSLGRHVPCQQLLAYIAGVWLVTGGMTLLWRRTEQMGAAGSAVIYFIFTLLWLPRFYAATHVLGLRIGVLIAILGGVAAQVLLVGPAAVVYAASALPDPAWRKRSTVAGRWMLGLPLIAFGLGHLVNHHAYEPIVPHWVPFKLFWVALTGIAFLLAGSAIVLGMRDVLAAKLLAMMLLVFDAAVELPPVFIGPHNQEAWGGAVYNLTAIGACWIFVEFVAGAKQIEEKAAFSNSLATSHPSRIIL